jgi:large subunit ribosomal protein L13e
MVKHNNPVPRNHFRKHWNPESSQKGHIKTFFQQPHQKEARRVKRQQKAKDIFPRPAGGALRPVVQACTQRYNIKARAGKGFSLQELKAAGVTASYARTIGVAVDHKRRNHSEEGLSRNTLRLKEYLSKLILFPLKGGKKATKQGPVAIASAEQLKAATQVTDKNVLPVVQAETHEAPRDLSKEEKTRQIYNYLRAKNRDEKFIGVRLARKNRKLAAEKAKKDGTTLKK